MADMTAMIADLQNTLAAAISQRLAIRQAPLKPSYNVHGHQYDWNGALRALTEEINSLRREIAELAPFEIVSRGM